MKARNRVYVLFTAGRLPQSLESDRVKVRTTQVRVAIYDFQTPPPSTTESLMLLVALAPLSSLELQLQLRLLRSILIEEEGLALVGNTHRACFRGKLIRDVLLRIPWLAKERVYKGNGISQGVRGGGGGTYGGILLITSVR